MESQHVGRPVNADMIAKTALPVLWLSFAYDGRWLISALPCLTYIVLDGSTSGARAVRRIKTWLAIALFVFDFFLTITTSRKHTIVLHSWIAFLGIVLMIEPG